MRARLALQAAAAAAAKSSILSPHQQLIDDICEHYVPNFLPGFEVVFIDDSDGDRISVEDTSVLKAAGLEFILSDAMPDVLLWHPKSDAIWVVEAVCSDGEVDSAKVANIQAFAKRNGKVRIDFTTAYPDWKTAADRQKKMTNLAPETFFWIRDDASKHFKCSAMLTLPSPTPPVSA